MIISARELAVEVVTDRRRPVTLLTGLSFDVTAGEWVSVVGPNGAGKSTLLRTLTGLLGYRGGLRLLGSEVTGVPARQLARTVAVVTQSPVVPAGITVDDYVMLGRTPHLGLLQREGHRDRVVVAEAVALLDLGDFLGRRMETLSGGELQRVYLARALAQQAPVLLLDEPTAALDVGHQQDVLGLVDRLRHERGLTVISTMHDLTMAGEYADRIMLLHRGRLVADGEPAAVLRTELLATTYGANLRVLEPGEYGFAGPVVVPVRR
ncbi:ABC transporter ATP-binding protein [Propionibacteriaceae bacterium Y2011]